MRSLPVAVGPAKAMLSRLPVTVARVPTLEMLKPRRNIRVIIVLAGRPRLIDLPLTPLLSALEGEPACFLWALRAVTGHRYHWTCRNEHPTLPI